MQKILIFFITPKTYQIQHILSVMRWHYRISIQDYYPVYSSASCNQIPSISHLQQSRTRTVNITSSILNFFPHLSHLVLWFSPPNCSFSNSYPSHRPHSRYFNPLNFGASNRSQPSPLLKKVSQKEGSNVRISVKEASYSLGVM